jgi:8-oxo-dGTP pyrophosphatase MutT (NUDIX family)
MVKSDDVDKETVAGRLVAFSRQEVRRPDLKHAAVAVCVSERAGALTLLLTRRAPSLRAHSGQWALPGGRLDSGETAADAAVRELEEEVGLGLDVDGVLGLLDDYVTRSGYVMTPVVLWADDVGDLVAAAEEVAEIHHVPLEELDVEPRFIRIPESDAPVIQLPLFGRFLHAPTAAIIYQFCQVALRGVTTRVAHFEQPVFAWR